MLVRECDLTWPLVRDDVQVQVKQQQFSFGAVLSTRQDGQTKEDGMTDRRLERTLLLFTHP